MVYEMGSVLRVFTMWKPLDLEQMIVWLANCCGYSGYKEWCDLDMLELRIEVFG
jgi:hypothetical protein